MRYFCTYFDQHYLPRGLALHQSLQQHCPEYRLWVLCMDEASYSILTDLKLPHVCLITLDELEQQDTALRQVKETRSRVEYYFTCSPSLPLFILENNAEVDLITYLDADLFFFSSPAAVYEEIADGSIAIIPHRFSAALKGQEKYGLYNVGWLSFRRDDNGLACLRWWRERCLEWCYDRLEADRFADQKYLDRWPQLFDGVVIINHKGANLAPWNLANYRLHIPNNQVWVDEQSLIFFHFQSFKQMNRWLFKSNLSVYKAKPSGIIYRNIYGPYIQTLLALSPPGLDSGAIRWDAKPRWSRYLSRISRLPSIIKDFLVRDYILIIKGRIF